MLILKSLKIKFHKINVITSNSYLQEKEKFTYIWKFAENTHLKAIQGVDVSLSE